MHSLSLIVAYNYLHSTRQLAWRYMQIEFEGSLSMSRRFIGQWKGYSESHSFVLINIEPDIDSLFGRVSVFEQILVDGNTVSYWTWNQFEATTNGDGFEGSLETPTLHYQNGNLMSQEDIQVLIDKVGFELPTKTVFKGKKTGEYELEVEWTSEYPTLESASDKVVLRKRGPGNSEIDHSEMSWHEFKSFALDQEDGLIFRGQARHWRLQTSFHRTGFSELITYLDEKLPEVERHISSISSHIYDIKDDKSLGALLNLAQHHGYPTPLLDWSKSPYVAAFFAFENEDALDPDGAISIFIFNERKYAKIASRVANTRAPNMMVRTLELPGIGNARVLPQQAITMYSNVDDIEDILTSNENVKGEYISAVSIPTTERKAAMRDLGLMGISWGSMFPGLDGVCKQLSVRHFKSI